MTNQIKKTWLWACGAICVMLSAIVNGDSTTNVPIDADRLNGEQRYLSYVSTDKPIYREGETIYLRAVFLNAADNTPVDISSADASVVIKSPRGETVFEGHGRGDDSVVGLVWTIPPDTPGGRYTAEVYSPGLGTPTTERSFDIRAFRAPRLTSQIEFVQEGYGPGDVVRASVKIERAEGGIPENALVTVQARVDGELVYEQGGIRLPSDGLTTTEFTLPTSMETGDGTLAFIVEDGGLVETASKTIPIVLQNLNIDFFPEGGDLVAGLASRVYLQAKRPDGKPADIEGRLRVKGEPNWTNKVVVTTTHEGRGVFSFVPDADKLYELELSKPAGITRRFELPMTKRSGTVITSSQDTFKYDDRIRIDVASSTKNTVSRITLYKREAQLDSAVVSDKQATVELDAKDAEGVLIVTAWSPSGQPLAERLIFREPKFAVNIELSTNAATYVPGGQVELDIKTTDENGKPVEAVVGLTATDDSVLGLIEERERTPRLPVMVYFENEVMDLADAHMYLDPDNPDSAAAVDLLLATQGWRRFILLNYNEIRARYPQEAMQAMAERQLPAMPTPMIEEVAVLGVMRNAPGRRNIVLDDNPAKLEQERQQALIAPDKEFAVAADAVLEEPAMVMMEDRAFAAKRIAPRPLISIREFAFEVRANRKPNDRIDFSETLFWHKGIRTSARDGIATVKFGLSDSVTRFRVSADAYGRNGALGSNDLLITSVEPFYLEPKMPLEVTAGDVIELPITLINATDADIDSVILSVTADGLSITQAADAPLAAGLRERRLVTIEATAPGTYSLVIAAAASPYADRVIRTLVVKPRGFPVSINHGGLLGPDNDFTEVIRIPAETESGSVRAVAKVYPSPLANMEEALTALLRQPNGCFEQTSSTNYPLVMAQQYFMSHQGIDPAKIAQARTLLDAGYKKLLSFESDDNGYEWFGANPAHEALTAYGLLEFVDMAKVMDVDAQMIDRTRDWLLARRDGKGGFKRNDKALDSFGRAPAPTTNAYIVWSLLESGESANTLRREIEAVKASALRSKDSYEIALAANIMALANDYSTARQLSQALVDAVDETGMVGNSMTSITQSGGDALAIETTSLALLAWLKEDARWAAQVETSMQWLFERSKAGRFGSTQSTILALKAINAYDMARAKPRRAGAVQLIVDGAPFGKPVNFDTDSKGAIELPDFSALLKPGEYTIALQMNDGSEMPFALEVAYHTLRPATSNDVTVQSATRLSDDTVNEGEPLEMTVTINTGDDVAPTPIAIIGIPAGLEVRHEQLKELVGADRISAYEVVGREVILYWRALKSNEAKIIPLSLIATVPGRYTAPASRAYLYYTDEHKDWVGGHMVTIRAR